MVNILYHWCPKKVNYVVYGWIKLEYKLYSRRTQLFSFRTNILMFIGFHAFCVCGYVLYELIVNNRCNCNWTRIALTIIILLTEFWRILPTKIIF